MLSKISRIMLAAFCVAAVLLAADGRCWAGSHKIKYFNSEIVTENGDELLRIEIGMSGRDLEYQVDADRRHPRNLIIDLDNTKVEKKMKKSIRLEGRYARQITFSQPEKKTSRIVVRLARSTRNNGYEVYMAEADRKARKPYRMVVDVTLAGKGTFYSNGEIKGRTIVIDPGHGGVDRGASGPNGTLEKEITLEVAEKVRDHLENSGVNVIMTREEDVDVYGPQATDHQELQARVDCATPDTDVFLSIHCNAFWRAGANGTETFYCYKSGNDQLLAQCLQDSLVDMGGRRDRGVKEANFYVLRNSFMPAALVELAFISNYEEEALLLDEDFQSDMAVGICEGLENYFAHIEPPKTKTGGRRQ